MPYRILCIGEILFDVYPEEKYLGGAPFNFAYHLHRLGQSVAFVSRIGQDELGQEIGKHLDNLGFPSDFIQFDREYPTGNVRVELDNSGVPTFDIVPNVAYDFIAMRDDLTNYMGSGVDLIYFGTLAQRGRTSRETIHEILQRRPENALSFCDINLRQDFYNWSVLDFSLKHSDIVKLNQDEFNLIRELFELPSGESEGGSAMMEKFGIKSLCITKGDEGSALFHDGKIERLDEFETPNVKVVDTVGAGDAYASILALGVLDGWKGDAILKRAGGFAAAVCGIKGAIPLNRDFYSQLSDIQGIY